MVMVPGEETFYFWCSEKSKLLGTELLSKMKELIETRPTLTELTGISESRLECFATHVCAYLAGSSANTQASATAASAPWGDLKPDSEDLDLNNQSSSTSVRHLPSRHIGGQALKGHSQYQGSLSPRPSSFKECVPRTLSSLKIASREKLKGRGDLLLPADSSFVADAVLDLSDNSKCSEASESNSTSPLSFLESLGKCNFPSPSATSQVPPISSLLSPYYCWCPPSISPITSPIPHMPTPPVAESLSLPPLSSLLSATVPSSFLSQLPSLDLAAVPPLEFPTFVSDPLARLPFSKTTSQQIPTFIPLMCDPIVHIPVRDVCSSGQGYLVSAGPALATSVPPLHPKLLGPLIPEGESMVDKGARETLRLLLSGSISQTSASLMDVLPAVLSEDKQGVMVTGSRGLYTGTSDVDAIVNSFAAVGLVSLSEKSLKVSSLKICGSSSVTTDAMGMGQASGGLDLQDPKLMFREEEKDC